MKQLFIAFIMMISSSAVICNDSGNMNEHTYSFSIDIEGKVNDSKGTKEFISANFDAAILSSFIGDYRSALKYVDNTGQQIPKISLSDSLFFSSFKPRNAKDYIIKRSKSEKVMIINEAHHNPMHRVFTLSLLKELYKNGYRYFGIEALSKADSLLNNRGYAITSVNNYYLNTGYYTAEPQFANLIHEALKIGFKLFPYDYGFDTNSANIGRDREISQAINIKNIIDQNPKAKILIHAGYDHIREDSLKIWGRAMAGRLRQLTGINPFTINQEKLSEKSNTMFENPYYKLIHASESSILMNSVGQVFSGPPNTFMFDVRVYHPRTTYIFDRPDWLQIHGRRKHYVIKHTPISSSYPLLVFAFRAGENVKNAVASDIIEISSKTELNKKSLVLDPGNYNLLFKSKSGYISSTSIRVD